MQYLIRLNKEVFPQDPVVCLGSQLKSIVEKLSELMESHVWLAADVDALSPMPEKLAIDSFQLRKIGDDQLLINLCENIDQFLSGVFIAVRLNNCKYSELPIGTEDEQFRSLSLDGVLLEIRAFDTSCFEMYSDDLDLMNTLSKLYKVEIHRSLPL